MRSAVGCPNATITRRAPWRDQPPGTGGRAQCGCASPIADRRTGRRRRPLHSRQPPRRDSGGRRQRRGTVGAGDGAERERGVHRGQHRDDARCSSQVLRPHVDPTSPPRRAVRATSAASTRQRHASAAVRSATERRSPDARKPSTRAGTLTPADRPRRSRTVVSSASTAKPCSRSASTVPGEASQRGGANRSVRRLNSRQRPAGRGQPQPGLVPGQGGELGAPATRATRELPGRPGRRCGRSRAARARRRPRAARAASGPAATPAPDAPSGPRGRTSSESGTPRASSSAANSRRRSATPGRRRSGRTGRRPVRAATPA